MSAAAMRPLAELDAETCRRLEGIVFDIDDTITEDAYAAMWRLREAGLTLVAVTGRPLGWVDVLVQLAPVDLAVAENGAGWVWRKGRRLCEGYWDDLRERRQQKVRLDALIKTVAEKLPEVPVAGDQRHRRIDLAFDVNETVTLPPGVVSNLCELIRAAGAEVLISSVHAHAFFGNHDKATGVMRAAREVLGRDVAATPERWLFVGDSGNDAAAFAYFPVSVGVANVREHLARLPTPPAFVTRDERGHGFAELAAHVLCAKSVKHG